MERANPVTPPSAGFQAAREQRAPRAAGRPPLLPDLNNLGAHEQGDGIRPPNLAPLHDLFERLELRPLNLRPLLEEAAGNHIIPADQDIAPEQDRMAVLAGVAIVLDGRHLISPGSSPQRQLNNNQQAEAGSPRQETPPGSPRSPQSPRNPQSPQNNNQQAEAAAQHEMPQGSPRSPEVARAPEGPQAPWAPKKPPRREF